MSFWTSPGEDALIYICEVYHNLPEGSEDLYKAQAGFLEERPYRPGEKEIVTEALKGPKQPGEDRLFIGVRELGGEKLATVLVPVRTAGDGTPLLVGLDVSIAEIWQAQMNLYLMLTLTIVVVTGVGIFFHYRILKRTVIRPIESLKQDTDELIGKLDSDEAYVLLTNFGSALSAVGGFSATSKPCFWGSSSPISLIPRRIPAKASS